MTLTLLPTRYNPGSVKADKAALQEGPPSGYVITNGIPSPSPSVTAFRFSPSPTQYASPGDQHGRRDAATDASQHSPYEWSDSPHHNQHDERLYSTRADLTPSPPAHLPLRKASPHRLRLRTTPVNSSPLSKSGSSDEENWSPSYPSTHRNGKRPEARSREQQEVQRPQTSAGNRGNESRMRDGLSPQPNGRHRATSASTGSRTVTGHKNTNPTPYFDPSRLNHTTPPSPSYGASRGQFASDASLTARRREPPPWHDAASEEVRTSLRSALTNASSYVETSGTERSSIITKSSCTSDYVHIAHANPPDDDGMSEEDAIISLYANGFTDDVEPEDTIELVDMDVPAKVAPVQKYIAYKPSVESLVAEPQTSIWPVSYKPPPPDGSTTPIEERLRIATQSSPPRPIPPLSSPRTPPSSAVEQVPKLAVPRDRYGFKKSSQYITVEEYDAWNKSYTPYLERRRSKWVQLMKKYGLSTDNPIRFPPKSEKVERFVRKGIPPEWRGAAWFWYAGGPNRLAQNPGLYQDLLVQVEEGNLSESDREHIERDLHRTFPDHIRFKPDDCRGVFEPSHGSDSDVDSEPSIVQALRRVLQAFAIHNPSIGYCQSLNFLAGLLLLFLDEDERKAFVLLNIITNVHLPGTHGVVLANVDIAVLMTCIRESMPAVWAKINDVGDVDASAGPNARLPTVSLATTSWFMTCFVGNLPIETVLRVWDSFFYEGSKILFRIALTIFKVGTPSIRAVHDQMEIFQVVQTIPRRLLDASALMEACFRRRNGFGHLTQETIDARRGERSKQPAAERTEVVSPTDRTEDGSRSKGSGLRSVASRARIRRAYTREPPSEARLD